MGGEKLVVNGERRIQPLVPGTDSAGRCHPGLGMLSRQRAGEGWAGRVDYSTFIDSESGVA